jgi:short-chain Z-isoprenyl diphosphate synthase
MPSLHIRRTYAYSQPMTTASEGLGAHPARAVGLGGRGRRVALWLARPAYALYTRRLRRHVRAAEAPRHLAVILDGNRRWALGEGLREAGAGHREGADKIDELLDWCAPLGIEEITVWALSNENLGRPDSQLTALFDVVCDKLDALEARALVAETALRLRVIGRVENLPERVSATIRRIESSTAAQPGPSLTIALGYSGRDELIDACKALVLSLATEGVPAARIAAEITRESLAARLYTAGAPDPDLIIRTSGEQRLSGFLPWQSTHSELYFTDVYWPAFRELDLLRALRTYQQRVRRHGL